MTSVPCGQCIGCRLDYSQSWAIRCLHEASQHEDNSFITLTYSEPNIPDGGSLNKKHYQDFMKRLRKEISPKTIRFYQCGEYGEKLTRPHYHALIFGYNFPDKELWSFGQGKTPLYRSTQLERLWPLGFSTVGELTVASAAYCARYSMKKIRGKALEIRDLDTDLLPYQRVDDFGEIVTVISEYSTMSRGGRTGHGIAYDWYQKYKSDVFPDDFVVIDGKRRPTPKYYRSLLEKEDPKLASELSLKRQAQSDLHKSDQTYERLAVREKVKKAQITSLNRTYEHGP